MLLRHFLHRQITEAATSLLAQLSLAKDAEERLRLAYEALQNSALLGWSVKEKMVTDPEKLPPLE